MNLTINAVLSELPTEILFFRYLTLSSKTALHLDILLETERQARDLYYKFLKRQGALDYIDYLITLDEKQDDYVVRLDNQLNYPKTVLATKITCDNVTNLLGQIKFLVGI